MDKEMVLINIVHNEKNKHTGYHPEEACVFFNDINLGPFDLDLTTAQVALEDLVEENFVVVDGIKQIYLTDAGEEYYYDTIDTDPHLLKIINMPTSYHVEVFIKAHPGESGLFMVCERRFFQLKKQELIKDFTTMINGLSYDVFRKKYNIKFKKD